MDYQVIWFILISILFIGYFVLEGFDFGVGILMPFVSKDDVDRRVVINTIGPFWDANEVWLITAGGAMFAAFPEWYATLFSGFYIPLFLMLLALILRAVGFEFRGKMSQRWWRKMADQFIFWGSLIPALLWGVAFTNIVQGVPIGPDKNFTGNLLHILNPYALLGGVVVVLLFVLHGALFLSLRTDGEIEKRVKKIAFRLWLPIGLITGAFAILGYWQTMLFEGLGLVPGTLPTLAILTFLATFAFMRFKLPGYAFASIAATILLGAAVVFSGLFPNVMPSSLDTAYSLTVYNASSSDLTLQIMTVVALFFVPIVLAYQGWSYYIFSKRVTRDSITRPE
ncbi:MAG: cytochrome d ubiquinol oxidase subunit II [Bacteroidales bacterium]|nr:cytochrome d ubiquinol oxidase subunit II [Bacteroidales bacterium]MCF8333076.1 cytochrome d ubiquinol oxidase subunit II [Bacteroidales bacterium]